MGEHLKHIRTIHFSLVTICFGLVISILSADNSELEKASREANSIVNSLYKNTETQVLIDPYCHYNFSDSIVALRADSFVKLQDEKNSHRNEKLTEIMRSWELHGQVPVFKDISLFDNLTNSIKIFNKERTLKSFQAVWEASSGQVGVISNVRLHRDTLLGGELRRLPPGVIDTLSGLIVGDSIPKFIPEKSNIVDLLYEMGKILHGIPLDDLMYLKEEDIVSGYLVYDTINREWGWEQGSEFNVVISLPNDVFDKDIWLDLDLPLRSEELSRLNEIVKEHGPLKPENKFIIPLIFDTNYIALRQVLGIVVSDSLTEEGFTKAFPALSNSDTLLYNFNLKDVPSVISILMGQKSGKFKAFGLEIPLYALQVIGGPLILIVQLYFLLHIGNLKLREDEFLDNHVGWIGIYPDSISKMTTVLSSLVVPFATLIFLTYTFDYGLTIIRYVFLPFVNMVGFMLLIKTARTLIGIWSFVDKIPYKNS